ncbi:methyltransferase domain-containing protein [candidate division KSB1 bacterium]|nr:methyltransferase domain-containing protein [candidate division KSB1 bacterium]
MNTRDSYNSWSETYDSDDNPTRDLDAIATENALKDLSFDSILEIGCGTGKNTRLLSKIGNSVHAIDSSPGMIAQAKSRVTAKNVTFAIANLAQTWHLKNQSFDLIASSLVLEHIEKLGFIFQEAARILKSSGKFYISELHPFRQYLGKKAKFRQEGEVIEVQAFVHHISDFLSAASEHGLSLLELKEWWHDMDHNKPPRLITFLFEK